MNPSKAALLLLYVAERVKQISLKHKGAWTKGIVSEVRGEDEKKWAIDFYVDKFLRSVFAEATKVYRTSVTVVLEEQDLSFSAENGKVKNELNEDASTVFLDPICYSTDHSRWLMTEVSCFPTRAFFIGGWSSKCYKEAKLTDIEVGLHYSLGTGRYFLGMRLSSSCYETLLNGTKYSLPPYSLVQKPIVAFPWYSNRRYDIAGRLMSYLSNEYKVFMGTGSTALDQALLFEGRIEGVVDLRARLAQGYGATLMPHDIAAIWPIAKGLGLVVTDAEGRDLGVSIWGESPVSLVAARREVHSVLLKRLKNVMRSAYEFVAIR